MNKRHFIPIEYIDFNKFDTDKERVMGYEAPFKKWACSNRQKIKNILEIGVHYGGSLLLWLNLYPNATIHGIDNEYWCKEYFHNPEQGIYIHILDQGNIDHLKSFVDAIGNIKITFDIIVDDGGHKMSQQQLSLKYLWKILSPGGFYIIEDLHTSHRNESEENIKYYEVEPNELTTLEVMELLKKQKLCETKYISLAEMRLILNDMKFCKIERGTGKHNSEISFLKRKGKRDA